MVLVNASARCVSAHESIMSVCWTQFSLEVALDNMSSAATVACHMLTSWYGFKANCDCEQHLTMSEM